MTPLPLRHTLFPYTTLFRSLEMKTLLQAAIQFEAIARRRDQRSLNDVGALAVGILADEANAITDLKPFWVFEGDLLIPMIGIDKDRKSTRLNSSHQIISYAV